MKFIKVRRIILTVLLTFTVLCFVVLAGYKGYFKIQQYFEKNFIPQSLVCSYQYFYSQDIQQKIDMFVQSQFSQICQSNFNSTLFCKKIKQRFKIIKSIEWKWSSLDCATLHVKGVQPLFLVNEHLIMGNKKRLFSNKYFEDVSLQSLRLVSIAPQFLEEKMPNRIGEFLKSVPDDCWGLYTVSYFSPTRVLFGIKHDVARCRLLLTDDVALHYKKLDLLSMLYDDFMARKRIVHSKWFMRNKYFTCDMRFKDFVCVKVAR